jgi:capsular polysaccharide biosynthesis protein
MSLTTPVRTPRDRLDRLTAVLSRAFRFWWVAAFIMVLGAGASLAAATLKKRMYTSETVLLYREGIRATYVLGREAEGEQTRKLGLRLKEMVLARPRLRDIIDQFKLYTEVVDKNGYIEAIDQMRANIVFKVREGDTFLLSYTDKDPETSQKVAARLAQSLIDENSKYRNQQAESTKDYIAQQKKLYQDDLGAKRQAMFDFMAKHPEFAQELGAGGGAHGGSAVIEGEKKKKTVEKGDPGLAPLEREAARIRQRLALPSAPRTSAAPHRDPRLEQAKQDAESEVRAAQRDLEEKQSQFTEKHPSVIAAKSRFKAAQERYKRAADALASGELIMPMDAPPASDAEKPALEKRLAEIENEEAAIRRRNESAKAGEAAAADKKASGVVQEIVDQEIEWQRLNQDVNEAQERYQTTEAREYSASMAAGAEATGQAAQIDIVDPAFKPTRPAGGGRMKVMLMGLLASMALALAIVLACAIFDDRLYERPDVEGLELAPLLVTIPRLHAGRSKRA